MSSVEPANPDPSEADVEGDGRGAGASSSTWARGHRERVDDLIQRQDWKGLGRYVAENWIAIWFSSPIGDLARVLADVPRRALLDSSGGAVLFVLALHREASTKDALAKLPPMLRAAAYAVGNRSVGDVKTSFRRFRPIIAVLSKVQRENTRTPGPVYPILLLQGGLSAIYAGQFGVADLWLAQAGQIESPNQAPFHRRDATAVRALLNAAYGSASVAEAQLRAARGESRTDSWVEDGVDAVIEIAEVALAVRRGEWEPPDDLLSLPWWRLQPHWPTAVWVVSAGLIARREHERLERLLEQLELSGLEAAELSGLFDSVFPAVSAISRASSGRPITASLRQRLAPHSDPIAQLAKTVDAIARNSHDESLI
ncbi:MAG: hypothetical protein ACTH31_04605, partial [Pseudoclavibacter sp.]